MSNEKDFWDAENDKVYSDIFNMPRHVSHAYPRMAMEERAAQFGAFEALTGFDDDIEEEARATDEMRELSEDMKAELDERLRILNSCADAHPPVKITYFVSDEKKSGGVYLCATGRFNRTDEYARQVIINERTNIAIDAIVDVRSPIFE